MDWLPLGGWEVEKRVRERNTTGLECTNGDRMPVSAYLQET